MVFFACPDLALRVLFKFTVTPDVTRLTQLKTCLDIHSSQCRIRLCFLSVQTCVAHIVQFEVLVCAVPEQQNFSFFYLLFLLNVQLLNI